MGCTCSNPCADTPEIVFQDYSPKRIEHDVTYQQNKMEDAFSTLYEQAANKAYGNLLADYSCRDWTPKEIKNSFSIYSKDSKNVKYKTVRAEIKINTDVKTAIDYITNPHTRSDWDSYVDNYYIVKRVTNQMSLIHLALKRASPLLSPRDLSLVMKIYELEDEMVVVYTSHDWHDILPQKGFTRTNWAHVAFIAKPGEDGILVTYISCREPNSGKAIFANYDKWHWQTGRILLALKGFLESIQPRQETELFQHLNTVVYRAPTYEEKKFNRWASAPVDSHPDTTPAGPDRNTVAAVPDRTTVAIVQSDKNRASQPWLLRSNKDKMWVAWLKIFKPVFDKKHICWDWNRTFCTSWVVKVRDARWSKIRRKKFCKACNEKRQNPIQEDAVTQEDTKQYIPEDIMQLLFAIGIVDDMAQALYEKCHVIEKTGYFRAHLSDMNANDLWDVAPLESLRDRQELAIIEETDTGSTTVIQYVNEPGVEYRLHQIVIRDHVNIQKVSFEAHMMKQKQSNILYYHEVATFGNGLIVVTDYYRTKLSDLVRERRLPETIVRYVIREVLRALQVLHEAGRVHREIHPDNIYLSDQGDVILGDYGYIFQCRQFPIKPLWVAPEQIQSEYYGSQSDIWNLSTLTAYLLDPTFLPEEPMLNALLRNASAPLAKINNAAAWSSVLLNFIEICRVQQIEERPTAEELLKHEVFSYLDECIQEDLAEWIQSRLNK